MNKYFKRMIRLVEKYKDGEIQDIEYVREIAYAYLTDGLISSKEYDYILSDLLNISK